MVSRTVSTVRLRGHTLRIHSSPGPAGSAEPPFVLIHGIGMSHRYLDRLHAELTASADTYAVDLPGFGPNPSPGPTLSVEDYAAVLSDLLAEAGVAPCILVGHSMGAQIAAATAVRDPQRVSGVVLIGPVVDRRRRSVWRQAAALGHDSLRELPSANFIVITDYLRTGLRWYLKTVRPMMEYRLETALRAVECPVLVMRGSRDPVAREPWCRELAEAAPNGSFTEIPGQPHVAQQGAPEAVADAIRAFLAGHRSGVGDSPGPEPVHPNS
ncbi:alpha/beta hydrolase [Arthrobacter sp. MSA 4-2]|uniref:alpha/beta fold hydrolase n=1 Tax=Arthrobacter sp. MSA 4-2 TaxID=2794349 RepID=UPI0018E8E822|nr:alpha/beta hydrolase [Arthrobacter sp. MSA 4-2]MBJ2121759.1 alpha/beta hydrolase [Arthrobacter sp. MSA 4-2]